MTAPLPFPLEAADLALLDRLLAWWCRPTGRWADDDPELHRVRLAFGVWVGRAYGQSATYHDCHGDLAGWTVWLRTDDRGLRLLRERELDELVQGRNHFPIANGPHLYVMDTVVRPDAPAGTYRKLLYRIVPRRAGAVASISGHLCKRDGRRLFHARRPDGALIEGLPA